MINSVIQQLRRAKLTGRGGACFPVADKWLMVRKSKVKEKYVVCNASEGEPQVEKDFYILKNYPESVIGGMILAMEYIKARKGILYLNPEYHKKLSKKLRVVIAGRNIELFKKSHTAGYIGGEETAVLNAIEKRKIEPRLKPPYPSISGLYARPTLLNNVETFYAVQKIMSGKFRNTRFFSVNGDCINHGVFELPENKTIAQVLENTENYPSYDFFVQVGGGASGMVYNSSQLERQVEGSASITVYSILKHEPLTLIKKWLKFYKNESCGQCTPCREGTHRLNELINEKEVNWQMLFNILETLRETSFCGLGYSVSISIESYVKNILIQDEDNRIDISPITKKNICNCNFYDEKN